MTTASDTGAYTAVVLAGDRGPHDALVQQAGACCKALVKVVDTPMLQGVVEALQRSQSIGRILLSGPPRHCLHTDAVLQAAVEEGRIDWLEPGPSPSSSAFAAMQTLPASAPVLVTTADHPLLRAEIVEHFLREAAGSEADVAVGLCRISAIRARFPSAHKTVLKFRDGGFCGCNLFAFLTPASRSVADAWRRVEQQRKNPLRVIGQLGWPSVIRYLLRRLSLENALEELSLRMQVKIAPVILPFPEAAIDVDSIADQQLVESIAMSER